jgi:carboxyl-terminal processing protease
VLVWTKSATQTKKQFAKKMRKGRQLSKTLKAIPLWAIALCNTPTVIHAFVGPSRDISSGPHLRLPKLSLKTVGHEENSWDYLFPSFAEGTKKRGTVSVVEEWLRRGLTIAILSSALTFAPCNVQPSWAENFGSMSDEQKAVAEAWRIVDSTFLDRTFNGQDWFKLRQDAVSKKYKNMEEAQVAIEKLVGGLGDKYTRYLNPRKYDSIFNSATGNLVGVGVELSTTKDKSRVVAADVEANSPASKGGIQPRDVFLEVDGTRFDDGTATPDDVASKLRGPEGSKVGAVLQRGDDKKLDLILTRAPIKITSVKSYLSDKGGVKVGVVRIKSFSGTTAQTVAEKVDELKKKGATSFVLDLRGNPGGLLPGGVDTASLFLEGNKPVVFVVNKKGVVDAQQTLNDGIDLDSPLAIYVDGNTASAAEVMTAALQENGRAVIVGEQTFGKGIVQTIRPLSNNNGGVGVTVARYETPQHHDINKQGIKVDIPVPADCESIDALACLPSNIFKKL